MIPDIARFYLVWSCVMPKGPKKSTGKSIDAVKLGHLGGKKGGPARAKKLTAGERSAIAKKGGKAKAAKHPGKAKKAK